MNSSAANLRTAVKGVASGTLSTLNGNFGSEVKVILKVTLEVAIARLEAPCVRQLLTWSRGAQKCTAT